MPTPAGTPPCCALWLLAASGTGPERNATAAQEANVAPRQMQVMQADHDVSFSRCALALLLPPAGGLPLGPPLRDLSRRQPDLHIGHDISYLDGVACTSDPAVDEETKRRAVALVLTHEEFRPIALRSHTGDGDRTLRPEHSRQL